MSALRFESKWEGEDCPKFYLTESSSRYYDSTRGLATAVVLQIAMKSVTLTESYLDKLLFACTATLQHCILPSYSCQVGNSCHYQSNRKADGSQSQLGHCGEANNLVLLKRVQ